MTRRGPKAKVVEFAGVGHAPVLMAEDQIAVVRDFLVERIAVPMAAGEKGQGTRGSIQR
jgi:hypothetical protein